MATVPVLAGGRRRLVKLVDQVLDSLQDVPSSIEWAKDFKCAMAPVEPCRDVEMSVKAGAVPGDLSGVYMRVGPNPYIWPVTKRTHVFDGDGMVHSVRIANGTATYNCDFLNTPRLAVERERGDEWFTRIGEMNGFSGLAKILGVAGSKAKLYGLEEWETTSANTAIACTPEGRVWALNEGGAPFQFKLGPTGAIESLGLDTLQGSHEAPISAHPKFCGKTGETWFHGRQIEQKTAYIGRAVGGKLLEKAQIPPLNGFNHDMFLTENYAVVIDGSMRFSPKNVVSGGALWAFDPKFKLKFGLFRRNQGPLVPEAIKWISAPVAAEIVHTLFAYEEGNKIVLWAPLAFHLPGKVEGILEGGGPFYMHKIVIDVDKEEAEVLEVEGGKDQMAEFPRFRDDRACLDCRYGFSGLQSPGPDFNFTGIMKWDMKEGRRCGEIDFPEGVIGGEPIFFPRTGSAPDCDGDNGYVGLLLRNHKDEESTFGIFDAKTFSSTPVCELLIPRRVSLGFHAAWITEEQFQKQLQ